MRDLKEHGVPFLLLTEERGHDLPKIIGKIRTGVCVPMYLDHDKMAESFYDTFLTGQV